VNTKTKLAKQRKAADCIADIMIGCLRELPKEEQKLRIKAIKNGKVTRSSRGNTPKRVSTPANFRERSPVANRRQKRVRL
jgi:hypothetical protein